MTRQVLPGTQAGGGEGGVGGGEVNGHDLLHVLLHEYDGRGPRGVGRGHVKRR